MRKLEIYTDGACKGNPGPGGYAAIIKEEEKDDIIIQGRSIGTTNNRMELLAAIMSLESLEDECEITLYSDSKYLTDAINKKWLVNWEKRNWFKADGKPTLNSDLWKRVLLMVNKHKIIFEWVKGHSDNEYNNKCDTIAVEESELAFKEKEEASIGKS